MKKSTRQIQNETPNLWKILQETAYDQSLQKHIDEADNPSVINSFVDHLEAIIRYTSCKISLTDEQTALLLFELYCDRIS